VHGALDYGVAASCAALPRLLGIEDDPESTYFNLQGAGETMIAALSDYNDDSGSRRGRRGTGRVAQGRRAA
jgi:hypothetical protein